MFLTRSWLAFRKLEPAHERPGVEWLSSWFPFGTAACSSDLLRLYSRVCSLLAAPRFVSRAVESDRFSGFKVLAAVLSSDFYVGEKEIVNCVGPVFKAATTQVPGVIANFSVS